MDPMLVDWFHVTLWPAMLVSATGDPLSSKPLSMLLLSLGKPPLSALPCTLWLILFQVKCGPFFEAPANFQQL